MKRDYEFYFDYENEALRRGRKLKDRLLNKYPKSVFDYFYQDKHLKFKAEVENVDVALDVYPMFFADEEIVTDLRYYIPFKAFDDKKNSFMYFCHENVLIGDLLNPLGRRNLEKKFGYRLYSKTLFPKELFQIGLDYMVSKEDWNPENKQEIARRYFHNKIRTPLGLDRSLAKHLCVYDYSNYVTEEMKIYFLKIRFHKSGDVYVGEAIGNWIYFFYNEIGNNSYYEAGQLLKKYGYSIDSEDTLIKDGLVYDRTEFARTTQENRDLLSMKFFPENYV